MRNDTFYDIHCHAMNLSHPNLLALLGRLKVERHGIRDTLFGPYASFFFGKPFVRMKNLLSVIENDLGSFFMLIEDDLAGKYLKDERNRSCQDRMLTVGGRSYGRIVLTPLIMDFEYRNMNDGEIHYNRPPSKPINQQIVDIANGIKQYRRQRPEGMLEIYPFLGMNTRNHSLKQLENLMQKYFGLYRPMSTVFKNAFVGLPSINISLQVLGNYLFSGVKLYPLLGFDPWPADDSAELEKVRFLYDFCMRKQIPLTTHCSESGFTVIQEKTALRYASPERWVQVLKEFPTLKVNFAHMGRQYSRKWFVFRNTEWQRRFCR